MKKASEDSLLKEAQALKDMPNSEINYDDIPQGIIFKSSERGRFYRPKKQPVTIRLDADILEWFKRNSKKYQTAINRVLREYVENTVRKTA